MDLNDLKNTVSNLTLYDIKAGFRKAQNAVMNYTEMEAKVREATNNEPWGASTTLMQEVANGTFNYQTLNEIMPMIYRRFTEKSAEEWRQIYKALQLLEFLIKHGSERVIDDARGHITLLKMLRQFHYIDQNGKDQGINVRNRAKELAELLGDVDRIRAERKKARATKNKYTGVEGGMTFGSGFSSSSRYGGFGSESAGYGGNNSTYGGYSGGVYGDGGGFGGQTNDFRDTSGRSDRFDEYDEFDEDERPSKPTRRTERAGIKKTTGESQKKKEPEVDLFSFDEPEQTSATSAATPSHSSNLADLTGPSADTGANDDDEFDDFQSATVTSQPATSSSNAFAQQPLAPTLMSPASSTARVATPQSLPAPPQAGLGPMMNAPSKSPAASTGAAPQASNYMAFASPPAQAQPLKTMGLQSAGGNYFNSTPASSSSAFSATPSAAAATAAANTKPLSGSTSKAAAGDDAFGALWGKASSGIRKTSTPTAGTSMGQLAKDKSSAGIWGAPAASSNRPAAGSAAAPSGGTASASDDLLG